MSTSYLGLCVAMCSNSPTLQAQIVGTGRCLLLIVKSTCEAELIASSEALQHGENISIVISEMINTSRDIEVSSDNAAAFHMVRNGSETAWRTRHISKHYGCINVEKRNQVYISTYF